MNAGHVSKLGLAERLFATCSVWLNGLSCYFIFIRPALLSEDLRNSGTTLAMLQAAAPRIGDWLDLVFKVLWLVAALLPAGAKPAERPLP